MKHTAQSLANTFAPTGELRVAINVGNPILASRHPETGEPEGVSIDMATQLAQRLGVPLKLVVFEAASKSVEAVSGETADVGFFAIDPLRGAAIAFTAPYVLIEGGYMVKQDSPLQSNEQVDQAQHTVVVGKGSAYDLYLSREIKHAQLVRSPTSPEVVSFFLEHGHDVAAGVKPQLEAELPRISGLRMLPGHFMVISQAMGLPKTRGQEAAAYLHQFVEEMKATGVVAQAMTKHRIEGATLAPLAG
ncbi:ABC transporter substrate-binding protein [Limnohabitans sp.]|uniref:ABC transporter substrate-binding protein n=1 Tax=Limnohabitans sp. TaxID=1907725 RepID=UPI00333EC95F